MHDQASVAFNRLRIRQIIMDAVAVECQRRIAKQQRWIKGNLAGFFRVPARDRRNRARGVHVRVFAVNQILPFANTMLITLPNVMAQGHKAQRTRAPILAIGLFANRHPTGHVPGPQRRMKRQTPTRPHTARQPHIRDQPANLGMAITTQSRGRFRRPEIQLVKERRQCVARLNARILAQRSLHRLGTRHIHHIALT